MEILSKCWGIEKVVAKNVKAIHEYYRCMDVLNGDRDYGYGYRYDEYTVEPESEEYHYSERLFDGAGIEDFENNLDHFEKIYIEHQEYDSENIIKAKNKLKQALKDIDEVSFRFVDYEPIAKVFYEETYILWFKTDGDVFCYDIPYERDIPITTENLLREGFNVDNE